MQVNLEGYEGMCIFFGDLLLTLIVFLWIRRTTKGKLSCNIFSAALAAALFLSTNYSLKYLLYSFAHVSSKDIKGIFYILSIGVVPAVSVLTLFLGNLFIPFFEVREV